MNGRKRDGIYILEYATKTERKPDKKGKVTGQRHRSDPEVGKARL